MGAGSSSPTRRQAGGCMGPPTSTQQLHEQYSQQQYYPAGAAPASVSVEAVGGAAGFVALMGQGFHTMGSLRRDGADLSRNAKLTYGVPPANEPRKRMQLQLQLLSSPSASPAMRRGGGGGARGAVRVASAKGERTSRPVEAVVGHGQPRPMSAAALLPGQSRPIRSSASAGALWSGGGQQK